MMQQASEQQSLNVAADIEETLNRSDVQQSIVAALNKLPKFMEQLNQLENTVDFAASALSDETSLAFLLRGLKDDLPDIEANHQTLSAIISLVNKLPKLVRYLEVLEPWIDFAVDVLADDGSVQHLTQGVNSLVEPIQSTVGKGRNILEDGKRRASADASHVGVFTLLKLLKEPTLQRGIKVAKSCLEVLEEEKKVAATS